MSDSRQSSDLDDYVLHVSNIPEELDTDGLHRVFRQYGAVTSLVAPDNKFAFVSYKTFAEAESAIANLDRQRPMFMRVKFSSRSANLADTPAIPDGLLTPVTPGPRTPSSATPVTSIPERDFRFSESGLPYHGRATPILPPVPMSASRYEMNGRHYPINPELYKYYDDLEYPDSSALWTRGQLTVDSMGRRKITGGRGYVYYTIPDPNPAAIVQASKIIEQRNPGRYVAGADQLSHLVDKCIACEREAAHCCSNCASSYCSRDCQIHDWPRHKNECSSVPPLATKSELTNGTSRPDLNTGQPGANIDGTGLKSKIPGSDHQDPGVPGLKPGVTDPNPGVPGAQIQNNSSLHASLDATGSKSRIPGPGHQIPGGPVQKPDVPGANTQVPSGLSIADKLADDFNQLKLSQNPERPQEKINTRPDESPRENYQRSKSHPEDQRRREPSRQTSVPSDVKKTDLNARLENCRRPVHLSDKDFEFKRQSKFLSSTSFTEVQITDVHAPSVFSVQKTCDIGKLTELMQNLNQNIAKFPRVTEIIPDKFYGAIYDGIWHRVQLILGPTPKIDYVDYGTIVEASPDLELRDIGTLAEPPRYSQTIRVPLPLPNAPEYQNLSADSKILVKMTSQDGDIINVEVFEKDPQPRKTPSTDSIKMRPPKIFQQPKEPSAGSPRPPAPKPEPRPAPAQSELPSVLSRLPKGTKATIEVPQVLDTNSATCVILTPDLADYYDQLLLPLKQDCDDSAPEYSQFSPKVNDLVCALKEDGFWVRGRVLSITPKLKVASLDEGIICEVVKMIPLLPRYAEIPVFACLIKTPDAFPLKDQSTTQIIVTGSSGDSIDGEFTELAYQGRKLQLKPWIISAQENGRPNTQNGSVQNGGKIQIPNGGKFENSKVEIKNNGQIAIQSYRDSSLLFIRSLEAKEVERYHRIVQETARLAQSLPPVKKISIGDKVIAQFKLDDNYYRAVVVDVKDQDVKIAYLDFGNQEVTGVERLREMPESLKQQSDCCVKVLLKGIEKLPMNAEVNAYLGVIADQETPFICSYDDKIQDGVVLVGGDGTRVNDMINKFLLPKWKEENQEEILKLSDIEMGKLGQVGGNSMALCFGALEPGYKYVFAPMDRELIAHLSTVLPGQLMEYAEKNEFYIPRVNELCVAMYEGEWCRGCCFNPTAKENSAEIYFMDYGNIAPVEHKDLRKMTKDFMRPCALGCICNVVDIAPQSGKPSPQLLARLKELLQYNSSYNIRILMYEDDEWTIEIPEIKSTLIKEGLITP